MSEIARRAGRQIKRWLVRYRYAVAADSPSLLDALRQVFLQDLIDDRTRYLAALPHIDKPLAQLRDEVTATYTEALQACIAELAGLARPLGLPPEVAEGLARPQTLAVELGRLTSALQSASGLRHLLNSLRQPTAAVGDGWRVGPMARLAPAIATHVWLFALQETALAMVLRDYRDRAVPDSARQQLLDLFARLHQVATVWRTAAVLGSMARSASRLHVALARNEGQVHLPLRAIDTAALSYADHDPGYHGRPDEAPLRLARQMRHADGVVLVTGYRGVGKSSFVNRALHHATTGQGSVADGWIVVPVALSLAKATNVASALRLTLRSIREALIDPATLQPRTVPGWPQQRLPLSTDELGQLEWAYERATWNVALSRSTVDEGEWSAGVGLGLNPGKFIGGGIAPSATLGLKRSRQQKHRRELSLRDYDEDAAEGDITQLIDRLAMPRATSGGERRIKLVLVFDELDKLDFDKSVEPLLDGLKNLFLHRHAVFVMVTSKQMYYKLHNQRAKEDATLSSYFSAVVHVPLMTWSQTRELLLQWLDRELLPEAAGKLADAEARTIETLARYLTYKSLGNPRDIIRELRQMQQWSAQGDRPFLSDRIANLGEVALIAAVQAAVEIAAVPWQGSSDVDPTAAAARPGELTLASERVGSDEARLEQIRRGLYILVEAAIDRQTLVLDAQTLEPLRQDNLSLLSPTDVLRLAGELGKHLALVPVPAAPGDAPGAKPRPLFVLDSRKGVATLSVTKAFYEHSGRRALHETGVDAPRDAAGSSGDPAEDARSYFRHGGEAERLLAIKNVGRMAPDAVPTDLVDSLREVVHHHPRADYRAAALSATPISAALSEAFGLAALAAHEGNSSVLTEMLGKAAAATGTEQAGVATRILLGLLRVDDGSAGSIARALLPRPDPALLEAALQALSKLASRDVSVELKRFLLANQSQPRSTLDEAMKALVTIADKHDLDLVDELLADPEVCRARSLHEAIAGQIAGVLHRRDVIAGVMTLLAASDDIDVTVLLRSVIVEAARRRDGSVARLLLTHLGAGSVAAALAQPPGLAAASATAPVTTASSAQRRLREALIGTALAGTVKPWLDEAWQLSAQRNPDDGPMVERARAALAAALEASGKLGSPLSEAMASLKGLPAWSRLGSVFEQAARLNTAGGVERMPTAALTGLGTSFATTYMPLRRQHSVRFDAWGALLLLACPLPFIATLFVPGDLPDGAGLGTLLLARTISLGLPVSALLLPWILITGQATRQFAESRASIRHDTSTDWRQQWQQYLMVPLLLALGGLVEAHKQYVGPLTFWPTQLSLFVLNCAALAIGYWGVARMTDERWSGGYIV